MHTFIIIYYPIDFIRYHPMKGFFFADERVYPVLWKKAPLLWSLFYTLQWESVNSYTRGEKCQEW